MPGATDRCGTMPRGVRILLDYRPALRERTGVGQYVHEMATALRPLLAPDDSLILFSSSWKDRLRPGAVPGASAVDVRIPVRALNFAWHRLEWPPIEMLAGPVDVAHSLHPMLMPARGGARVITIHDLDFLDHPERTRAEIRRDYQRLAHAHSARADLVVVNSNYTAGLVETRLGVPRSRLVVCRPGAPSAWPRRDPPAMPGPILFVGTIEPRKNLPVLFSAFEQLVQTRSHVPPLVLAGKSVEYSASILEPVAAVPRLAERVRYLGYVSDVERLSLYHNASMLVLPSVEEGFGITALEAMHMGVPVVASDRGALPEVIGNAGTLVDPLKPSDLAAAIAELLDNPALRTARAEMGRARAAQFTWASSAADLLQAYRQIVGRRRSEAVC